MSEKRNKTGEAGWIAEEIFEDAVLNLRSKCLAIDDQIARGVLDLEDALDVYEVSVNDYIDFFIKEQSAQAEARFRGKSTKLQTLLRLKYLNSYFDSSFNSSVRLIDDAGLVNWISTNIHKLQDEVEHGRVKVISE
jgi:hypothetical protein